MANAVHRKASARTILKRSRSIGISVDNLAEQLTSNLVISVAKGKRKATTFSEDQTRIESMRVVNSASQQLSAAVQSGWKKSSNKGLTQVTTAAATAAQYLAMLRRNSSGDVNIERVAMTVLGKLVSLELYDEAFSALEVLHSRLCNLLNVAQPQSCARNHLIQIPFPASEIIDPTLLTLTLTYLAYSLTILTNESQLSPRNSKEASANLDALSDVLDGKETSFLAWIPRTYTSVGTVESTTFWDQVVRFGAAFVKSQEVGEEAMHAVLAAFTDLVSIVEKRDSASHFLSGRGFVGFCEYWLVFAKRVTISPDCQKSL
ncbi:hypothetical protein C0989_004073 [Termitomyces sp. Mn162]|nr:hypothetical protein C0989_004073 [Termitomyces sp. Mn162]